MTAPAEKIGAGAQAPDPAAARRVAPAVGRNRDPILAVLRRVMPERGLVVEIASGTGEHALWFSTALPSLGWQPTDRDQAALDSIAAWRVGGPDNLLPPLHLDAASPDWPVMRADAVVSINMVHIAPWAAAEGLMAGAGRILPPGGLLFLYGPFREGAAPLAPGNATFDADLKVRHPDWGLRELDDVAGLAARHGMILEHRIEMPANNLSLIFRKG